MKKIQLFFIQFAISCIAMNFTEQLSCNTTLPPGLIIIKEQPKGGDYCIDSFFDIFIEVTVDGICPGTLRYQWFHNGMTIPGANDSHYIIPQLKEEDAGVYTCWIDNDCDHVESLPAMIMVKKPPIITKQPVGGEGCADSFFDIFLEVSTDSPPKYQLLHNGLPEGPPQIESFFDIFLEVSTEGIYQIVVTNDCGSVTSEPAILTVKKPPIITKQPLGGDYCIDSFLDIFIEVSTDGGGGGGGIGGMLYQWYHNGEPIPGATDSRYTIDHISKTDEGAYFITTQDRSCTETPPVISESVIVTVKKPPVITQQPSGGEYCVDSFFDIFIEVSTDGGGSGIGGMLYQWYHNGEIISGATDSHYILSQLKEEDSGTYTCGVDNDCDNLMSGPAIVNVNMPLVIQCPPDEEICYERVHHGVVTTSRHTGIFSVSWYDNDKLLEGYHSTEVTIGSVTENSTIRCVIDDVCGIKECSYNLTVKKPPVITQQPLGGEYCVDSFFDIFIEVSTDGGGGGGGIIEKGKVKWFHDGTAISGAEDFHLTIEHLAITDAGDYYAVVSNDCGSVTSDIVSLLVNGAPEIKPLTFTRENNCVDYTFIAEGTAISNIPVKFQWNLNAQPITGAIFRTYEIMAIQKADAGEYTLVVSNACGSSTSETTTITVSSPPEIITQPVGGEPCIDSFFDIFIEVSTDRQRAETTFQWYHNGQEIPGANDRRHAFDHIGQFDEGEYYCVVTNDCGSVTSETAVISVNPLPVVTVEDIFIYEGSTGTLTAEANDEVGITRYEWDFDSDGIYDWSSAEPILEVTKGGKYCVRVTNENGCQDTAFAYVTVFRLQNATVCENDCGTLGVIPLSREEDFIFQWSFNGEIIEGATGATYTICNASAADAGDYGVIARDLMRNKQQGMQPPNYSVNPLPEVNFEDIIICEGSTGTLRAETRADGRIELYEWDLEGDGTWDMTTTESTIEVTKAGKYCVRVTDENGCQNAACCKVNVNKPLEIITQPIGGDYCIDSFFDIWVEINFDPGSDPFDPPPAYQWYHDGELITGAEDLHYTISKLTQGDAGEYSCVVSNGCGSVTSNTAKLIVKPGPNISKQPEGGKKWCFGVRVKLAVELTETKPTTKYQWYHNGEIIPEGIDSFFDIFVELNTTGEYYAVVSDECGSVTSDVATIEMETPPEINICPTDQKLYEGNSICLEAEVSGSNLNYIWKHNGEVTSNEAILCLNNMTESDKGTYKIITGNNCGLDSCTFEMSIEKTYKISGTVTYNNTLNSPLSGVKVYLTGLEGQTVGTTDINGKYEFINIIPGTYNISATTDKTVKGVDPTDALLDNRYFVGIYTFPNEIAKIAGNVNNDTPINPTDALLINRRFVRVIETFSKGDWYFETKEITVIDADVTVDFKGNCYGDVNGSYKP